MMQSGFRDRNRPGESDDRNDYDSLSRAWLRRADVPQATTPSPNGLKIKFVRGGLASAQHYPLTSQQVRLFMQFRRHHPQRIAAAKAGFSERTARRIESARHLPPREAAEPRPRATPDPFGFNAFMGIGCAHFTAGRYADAVHWFEKGLLDRPTATWVYRILVPALALLGRQEEARAYLSHLLDEYPGLTIAKILSALPFSQQMLERVAEGLKVAGMPE